MQKKNLYVQKNEFFVTSKYKYLKIITVI